MNVRKKNRVIIAIITSIIISVAISLIVEGLIFEKNLYNQIEYTKIYSIRVLSNAFNLNLFIICLLIIYRHKLLRKLYNDIFNWLKNVIHTVIISKKIIFKKILILLIILICSVCTEFSIGKTKLFIPNNKEMEVIKNSSITIENARIDEQERIISESGNAIFTINNSGKYIKNLKININNNTKTVVTVLGDGIELGKANSVFISDNGIDNLIATVIKVGKSPQIIKVIIEAPNTIVSSIAIDNSYYFNWSRFIFIFGILCMIYTLIYLYKKSKISTPNIFLVISLVSGSITAFCLPVNTLISWDDETHYKWALEQSYIKDAIITEADNIFIVRTVPTLYSLDNVKVKNNFIDNQYKNSKINSIQTPSTLGNNIIKKYNKIGHLPSSIMLFLARTLQLPYHIVFILGRWINVLVYSVVVYFAIKRLKTGRIIMAIVALFPTAIFLSANYNYDSWITCFTMLGMAYLFSELQQPDKKITTKECIIMLGSFVVAFGPKAIYFPILFLPFLININKFDKIESFKNFRLAIILSIVFVAGSFVVPFVIIGPGLGDTRGGSGVNALEQVKFILSHPIGYAKILFSFIKDYITLENSEGFMTFFAYLGHIKNHLLLLIVLVIAVFTDKSEYDEYTTRIKTRSYVFISCLLSIILICTALYVSFTPVASTKMAGFTLRYLLPLVFPLLYVLGSAKISNNINEKIYVLSMLCIPTFILFQGIWLLCIKVYF